MDSLLAWLSKPDALLLCLTVLFVLIITPVYIRITRLRKALDMQLHDMEDKINENLKNIVETTVVERSADREEMGNNLRGMSDSVVRIMGEMSRTQQQQLDSFGGQIRAMSRTDEERMERMRSGIGEKLQDYNRQMSHVAQSMDEKFAGNDRRLAEMRQMLSEGLTRIQGGIDTKLDSMRDTMNDKLNLTVDKRLGESFKVVTDRLEQVYEGLGEMQSLAIGVGDLKRILTSVKTRGVWGEVQLEALLEQVLTANQYEKNAKINSGSEERVDFVVCFPSKDHQTEATYLPIDAKFPIEEYHELLEAVESNDNKRADAAGRALEISVRNEAKRIHKNFIKPPHTTDFAIMFLPIEGLYAEVLKRNGIVEQLQTDYRVVLTGPTTLLALLNSLQMGFRTIAIEKRSSEVWELLGAVKTEFGRFVELLNMTQQRLIQASASIEDAAKKSRYIHRKLHNVQEVSALEAKRLIEVGEDSSDMEPLGLVAEKRRWNG